MSLWRIAWRSIQQRALASTLTAISMALGVMLVVAVLVIQSVVYQSFHRGGEGYDLIIGPPKGSNLQLVLSSIYYLDQPASTMPYSIYKDLDEGRLLSGGVRVAVPIALGDSYGGFRVVGTTPDMFDKLSTVGNEKYAFAAGKNFQEQNYYDAVIGATVARKTGLGLGDTFRPSHDVAGGDAEEHKPFTVVGILQPTGTPNDRAIFVNIEGFYRVGGHMEGIEHAHEEGEHDHDHDVVPDALKRVSAVLICTHADAQPGMTRRLKAEINRGKDAQAAIPADEIDHMFEQIIGNIELVLLGFAVMIVLVAGIGIMVSIYNSMSDRRHEIAVMRALGAGRLTVMAVILLESIILSIGGGLLGLGLGHGLIAAVTPVIADKTGLAMGLLQFRVLELILIPALLVLASVVGYLPAVAAYRTDVARSLTANP